MCFQTLPPCKRHIETAYGTQVGTLPLRTLPPGSVKELWDDYKEVCGPGVEPASYAVFVKSWRTKWNTCLEFRPHSTHAECSECIELKEKRSRARDPAAKLEAIRNLREHRLENQADRGIMTSSWNAGLANPVLTLTVDGMDQAKFRIPRARKHRESHEFQRFKRPKCIVVGAWVAHVCLCIFVMDALQPHDSNLTLEVVARTLERAKLQLEKLGLPFPKEIQLWVS